MPYAFCAISTHVQRWLAPLLPHQSCPAVSFCEHCLASLDVCGFFLFLVKTLGFEQKVKSLEEYQVLHRLGQCFMQPAHRQAVGPPSTSLTAGLSTSSFKKPLLAAPSAKAMTLATADRSIRQQPVKPVWQHAEGAAILNKAQWQKAGEKGGVCPVVVDPHVGRHLRPHQSHGVHFLYECIMGLREGNRSAPWSCCWEGIFASACPTAC